MTALLAGELRRVLARRLVRVVFAVVALAVVIAGVVVFVRTSGGHRPRIHLTVLKGLFEGVTAPLALLSCLMGASVIGAEWPSRTITTILTWEPRRVRVLSAKAVGVLLVGAALTVLALAALALILLPSTLLHGSAAGTTSRWWQSLAGAVLRTLAMTAIATVVGFSIASIGRNTAAALGVLFGYVIVLERVVGAFIPGMIRWLIIGNAVVFVSGRTDDAARGQTVLGAGLYLGVLAVGLFTVALVVFQRRDVA